MTAKPSASGVTYEEYLALEERSGTKHEYLRGEIFDMSGGTPGHAGVAAAFIGELRNTLTGRPCRVFTSDMKVRVEDIGLSTYPDVSVVCGTLQTSPGDPNAITNPIVLVEVLSPATEAHDRGVKFSHYRHLPSLREMVFVNHAAQSIEVYRKNDAGRFELHVFEAEDVVELASVGAKIPVKAIYFDPLAVPA